MGGGDSDPRELRSDDRSEMLSSSMVAEIVASPEAGLGRIAAVGCPEHRSFQDLTAREAGCVGVRRHGELGGQTKVWAQV